MLDVRACSGRDQEVVERQRVRLLKRRRRPCPAPLACEQRLCAWIGAVNPDTRPSSVARPVFSRASTILQIVWWERRILQNWEFPGIPQTVTNTGTPFNSQTCNACILPGNVGTLGRVGSR